MIELILKPNLYKSDVNFYYSFSEPNSQVIEKHTLKILKISIPPKKL